MFKSIEFFKGKSRGEAGGGSTSVCSVILRRYSLQEVPRRRIHNAIAKAMSICVAVGNKVMDTRLPQPAGCGDKYDVYGWCRGRRVSIFSQSGRSMIEMLGVLAIIAVLTVGGIAGYSKAMEKFKVNKIINEYSFMLAGIVEHADDLGRNSYRKESGYFGEGLVDWIEGMNLVPATWHRINDIAMSDSSGNVVQWYKADNRLAVDFYLGGWQEDKSQSYSGWLDGKSSASFSPKLCVDMFESLVQPMHHVLHEANTFNSKQSGKGVVFLGDSICGSENKKCLSSAKLADFHQACQVCDATGVCAITLWFQL